MHSKNFSLEGLFARPRVHLETVRTIRVDGQDEKQGIGKADRDLVAVGIATAAIILFVATGSSVLPSAIDAVFGGGKAPDYLLVNALLLNIVLIIFGWRRYNELQIEIGERRQAEELARELAETDPLTDCLNRRSMESATEALRARAAERNLAVAYCMVDLDNFKQINDMHGHTMGDFVLVELAKRIQAELPKHSSLARLGGDEFAVVTTYDPKSRERVDDLVIRLFEAISRPFESELGTIDATVSIGLASDHDDHGFDPLLSDAHALMQRSDIAMYHAKKEGKGRFFWFETSMENELRFRNQLESGIRQGLHKGEFVPYYEQQIDLETGELVGFEMLARWTSPELGLVSPEIFIPIAEELGLIGEMSEQLMTQAFADAREWHEDLTLAINISPLQLRDPWFAQKLLRLLVKQTFPPHRLEVEITESCLHEDIGIVRKTITSLRNQGVRVSLDDFGTGYSSLEQLRTLPFDRLKIDRAFVTELRDTDSSTSIVDAIVSLSKGLDMPITAEGIEDKATLDALRKMGKLKGQGYLYGRPETADQVRERLAVQGKLNNELDVSKRDISPASKASDADAGSEEAPDFPKTATL